MEKKKRAILIGAGEIEDGGLVFGEKNKAAEVGISFSKKDTAAEAGEIREADLIIALDGGLLYCEEKGIRPDYIIGDFDSLPAERQSLLEKYPAECILRLPKEKDDTDMLAAIKFAIEKGIRDFVIYGGLGGRLSHTIANLQCLMYLKQRGMNGLLLGKDTKAFLLQNEEVAFAEGHSGYISVFAYSEKAEAVTLKGLKYELEDAELTAAFPLGVSNEFVGKEAIIGVRRGILLVVMDR